MQPTRRSQFGLDPPATPGGRALPPLGTFVGLLALLAVALFLARSAADPPPLAEPAGDVAAQPKPAIQSNVSEPAPSLTRAQAVARYRALDALRLRAYRERDVSLFTSYLTADSGLHGVGRKEIARMRADGVVMRPRARTRRITVRHRGPRQIVVRHTSVQAPRFYSSGKDITIDPETRLVTVDWFLRPSNGTWKIFNSRVTKVKPLRRGKQ
ncbi:MAG: hypothetical protein M3454_11250 [Actinomycetota bacterium]|nr:hypothetical protein [Actinomycetota bacterium]